MKDVLLVLFSVFIVMLQMMSAFLYMTHFFGFRVSNIRIYLILFGSALCGEASLTIKNIDYSMDKLLYIVLLVIMAKSLNGNLYKKIFHYCFLCFFLIIQKRIAAIIYSTNAHQNKSGFFVLIILITVVFALFVFLLKRFKFDNDVYMTREEYLILSIIPFLSVILVHFITLENEMMMSFLYLFLFMVNMVAIFMYYFILYKDYQLQILQIDHMQSNFYEDFLKQERELATLKHDLKNILSSVGYYLEVNECDQAMKLISELSSYQSLNVKYTGILAIDSILNSKLKIMNENSILYDLDLQIPKDLDVSRMEITLCSILGNLLDNSIESVKTIGKDGITIKIMMRYYKNKLIIKVINPCITASSSNFNSYKIRSTKGKRYGIGLSSIKDKVNRYKGYYHFEIRDSNFHAVVVLPMDNC